MRRPQSGWRQFPKRTDGMSAVEFALLLPVMLLIVCGIMDFGKSLFSTTYCQRGGPGGSADRLHHQAKCLNRSGHHSDRIRQYSSSDLQSQPPGHRRPRHGDGYQRGNHSYSGH